MTVPEVSVIMPVRNRAEYVRSAIGAVLGQTFAAWELVIADDGSDDPATLALLAGLADPRIRVLRLGHGGSPAAARNAAMAVARGEVLAFLDSDDLWPPTKLAVQLAALRARPECGWSYGHYDRIDAVGLPLGTAGTRPWVPHERDMVRRLLRIEALVATPTVLMRRALAEALGGFDPALLFAEDYDLWIRAAAASAVAVVPEVMALIRVHPHNHSVDRLGAHRGWVQLYDKVARTASDPQTGRLARRLQSASALTVAQMVAGRPGGPTEARRLARRHGRAWLLQPAAWSGIARLVPQLLRG